jgi:hypothetical protein
MGCTAKTTRTKLREIIETVVDLMRKKGTVSSVVDNGNGTATFSTDSTDGLTVGLEENPFIEVGGVSYEVVSFTADTDITVNFSTLPSGSTWTADAPYVYHGNPIQISNEIDKEMNPNAKYPAIIVFENGNSIQELAPTSTIESTESLEMFFVDMANYNDWLIEDFYSNVVNAMEDLSYDFVDACRNYKYIEELTGTATRERISKWGVQVLRSGKGSADTIFNDNLSGVSLRIDLPISRALNDECL